jgi:glycosyltransferase involved in cell wall biosynthesis
MGPTLATEVLLNSALRKEYDIIHLDTSDHRPLSTLGALDVTNVFLALRSYVHLVWRVLCRWPDLIYIPISQTTIGYLRDSIYILLSRLLGRRVVCHLRGGNFRRWLDGASGPTRRYVRAVHRLVDGQIVLGECLRPLFAGLLPPERIFVVPNGKDLPRTVKVREVSDRVHVLFLSNMRRAKGVLDVLHSVPLVLARQSNVEFLFAGAWNEPDVRAEVLEFLEAHPELPIRWIGAVSGAEKATCLECADIFVLPTYYPAEGHPWVIVEALAAGLPIISADQGAVRESVFDGVNGFLVDKQRPDQIADKLVVLLRDSQLRESMGQESAALYQQRFTEGAMIANLQRAFDTVLGRPVARRSGPENGPLRPAFVPASLTGDSVGERVDAR